MLSKISYKHFFIFLIALFCFSKKIKAQNSFSLEECIEIAFRQNPEVQLQNLNILKSNEVFKYSKKNLLPSVSGSISQSVSGGRSIDPFSNSFVQRNISSNSFGISSNWNIFNGFQIKYQIDQNRISIENERQLLELKKKDLKIAVIEAFMQVLIAQELVKIASEQKRDLEMQYNSLKEKLKEGIVSRSQLSDFDAQIANVSFEEFNSKNNLKLSKLNLVQWLGFSSKAVFEVKPIKFQTKAKIENVNLHPSLKMFETQLSMAQIGTKIAEANKYPSLNFGAGLGSAYSSAAASEIPYFKQLNFNFNQYFRLGLNIPIYNNGQTKAKISNALIQEKIIKKQFEQQNLKLNQENEKQKLEIELLQEKSDYSDINKKIQEKAYLAAKERFEEGLINSIELNSFRINFEKASITLIQTNIELSYKSLIYQTFLE